MPHLTDISGRLHNLHSPQRYAAASKYRPKIRQTALKKAAEAASLRITSINGVADCNGFPNAGISSLRKSSSEDKSGRRCKAVLHKPSTGP